MGLRLLVPVFFHAPMGGLHLHVLASVEAMVQAGHDVTVVCKPGPFEAKVKRAGATVVLTDFSSDEMGETVLTLMDIPFDLVYAHPFAARQLGLVIAELQQIPFVLVIHGMYNDDLPYYAPQVAHVIAVSEQIADSLRKPALNDRISVILNGVDESYQPEPLRQHDRLRVVYAARLDNDMTFPLDVLFDAISDERLRHHDIDWHIVGSGTQELKYRHRFAGAMKGTNQTITWHGWCEPEEVKVQLLEADVVVAPSRVAIESIALGRPTIAVGSKGYHGLITEATFSEAEATNFGGIGTRHASYTSGMMGDVILTLMDEATRQDAASFSATLAGRYHQSMIQAQLLRLLETVHREGHLPAPIDVGWSRFEQLRLHRELGLLQAKLEKRESKIRKLQSEE